MRHRVNERHAIVGKTNKDGVPLVGDDCGIVSVYYLGGLVRFSVMTIRMPLWGKMSSSSDTEAQGMLVRGGF